LVGRRVVVSCSLTSFAKLAYNSSLIYLSSNDERGL
jgi:hypothetical protein